MHFRSGGKSKYRNLLVLARAGSSCLYIFRSQRIDEVFLAVTRGKIGICYLFRKRLLELCAEEIGKDAPFVSLYIYNKVSLLSSDVILPFCFLFFQTIIYIKVFIFSFVNISENFYYFFKLFFSKFGGYLFLYYLCTRFRLFCGVCI